jgi:hypothetical protein
VTRRCTQTTAAGEPCRSWAVAGSDRCSSHLRLAGRKPKLTTETADQLVAMLRSGVPLGVALATVNVGKQTFYRWVARSEPRFVVFRERVEQARAVGEAALFARVALGPEMPWQSAAWLLERQWPERWAPISRRPPEREDD